MQTKTTTLAAAAAAAVALAAGAASAQIAYDALGFEVPSSGFQFTGLEGQAGGSPERTFFARQGTNTTAVVSGDVGVNMSDAVQFDLVDNPGTFDSGDYGVIVPATGSAIPDAPVMIDLALQVLQGPAGGPLFGFTAFGSPANAMGQQPIAAEVFVNSADGSLFINDTTSQLGLTDTGFDVELDEYNFFSLDLDYDTKTFDLVVDGSSVGTFGFRTMQNFGGDVDSQGRVDDFRGVTLAGFESGGAPTSIAGTAFYDNLVVAVPEPAVAGLFAVAGLTALRRRRA